MSVSRRQSPCRWYETPLGILAIGAVLALLCGVCIAPQGLLISGTIGFVIVLGMGWPWLGLRGLRCELQFQQRRSSEGELVPFDITVINRWPWPVWGLAIEQGLVEARTDGDATTVALARVSGWSKSHFTFCFRPECRGVYPRRSPFLTSAFPFGLWKATLPIRVLNHIIVWPRRFELSPHPLPVGRETNVLVSTDHRVGCDEDYVGVRPYRRGDSLRNVHWALTARHERFVVCERQGKGQATVQIDLDADCASHAGLGPNGSREWGFRAAASLCQAFVHQNALVCLRAAGRHWQITSNGNSLRKAFDGLAMLDAGAAPPTALEGAARRATPVRDLTLSIHIGTEHWPLGLTPVGRKASRRIVFCRAPANDAGCALDAWIVIGELVDVPAQFAQQWDRSAREYWCGTT